MLNLSHTNPEVYKLPLKLIEEVYIAIKKNPKAALYVLVSPIRRAAILVCSNIAEGASSISKKEKKRFYEISRSSLVEMDTQFEIAIILNYYKNGQMKEMEQYLKSTFRMHSKMICNLSQHPTATSQTPVAK